MAVKQQHHAAQRNVSKEHIVDAAVKRAGLDKSCKPIATTAKPARKLK